MSEKIQAIRGMNDILPQESFLWQQVERLLRQTLNSYGYEEIRLPIVEKTALFSRAIGEVTDVVEKEMYSFVDRQGDSLSLRPEGTAGCVRACLEHNLCYNQEQRLWYMGPMFRHERPQKGRYRQFHQMGVEVFGLEGPDIDAEIIILTSRLWQALGIADHLTLQLNSLGSAQERAEYRKSLVAFLEQHFDKLDEDSKRRTHSNPLRVLDSKDARVQELLKGAPRLEQYFGEQTVAHFKGLCTLLDAVGIKYQLNPNLVRGLDYYNLTVFEWVTDQLGAQGTVCGGGRYDGLIEQLGGNPTCAVGFGLGLERLLLLLTTLNKIDAQPQIDIYIMGQGERAIVEQALLALKLRERFAGLRIQNHCGGGSFKRQFKRADKLRARLGLVLGEQELERGLITVKELQNEAAAQRQLSLAQCQDFIRDYFKLS